MAIDTYTRSRNAIDKRHDARIKDKATQRRWIDEEDVKRIADYPNKWKLFIGKHYVKDGGVWQHPYGQKGIDEDIPYQQANILGKGTRTFADLIVGGGIVVISEDKATQAILETLKLVDLWQVLIMASVYGFVGLQPLKNNDETIGWFVVKPQYLYPKVDRLQPSKVLEIKKCVPFLDVEIAARKKIDILYQETHTKGSMIIELFEIQGEYIVREIGLEFYRFIDPDFDIYREVDTMVDDFLISLVYNEKIDGDMYGDYNTSAQRNQQSLNSTKTQIARILKMNADPRLKVSKEFMTKDEETGKWSYAYEGAEVLVIGSDMIKPEYLVWDGNVEAAERQRDNLILTTLSELDVAPQLTSFTHLVGGTVAETSAKLKQMLHSTIKKTSRKQYGLEVALKALITNILILSGIKEPAFTILWPEFIPQGRDEVIEEVIVLRDARLMPLVEALMKLDGLTIEEAEKKAVKIYNEKVNDISDTISPEFFPPIEDEE